MTLTVPQPVKKFPANSWKPKIHQRVHETPANFSYPKPDKSSTHPPILLHLNLF